MLMAVFSFWKEGGMYKTLVIALLAFSLAACGSAASVPPTVPQKPTLTTDERAGVQLVKPRMQSMVTAAKDLQKLGGEIRATVDWQVKVRTAAQIITGGQKVISQAKLPAALAKPIQDTAATCAKPAETLLGMDTPTVAAVKTQNQALQQCITEMGTLQIALSGL